jgi:hypothetical protein
MPALACVRSSGRHHRSLSRHARGQQLERDRLAGLAIVCTVHERHAGMLKSPG